MSNSKPKLNLTTSWDDYNEQNGLLAEVLKRFNIPAVWFIEVNTPEKVRQILEFSDMGFEIGSHTVNHTILRPCDEELQRYEIFESKKAIECITKEPVEWFCYPRGRFDKTTIKLVKEAGYKYARTTNLGIVDFSNPYRLNTTCHCFARREYGGLPWEAVFKTALLNQTNVHLWGHMKEIVKQGDLPKLESLFRWLKENYELV